MTGYIYPRPSLIPTPATYTNNYIEKIKRHQFLARELCNSKSLLGMSLLPADRSKALEGEPVELYSCDGWRGGSPPGP